MPISSSEPAESQRAKAGSFASAAELREFVQNMKGRSPQEVLGAVANSGLLQGVAISTLGTIFLIALFTAGPYFLYGKAGLKAKATQPAEVRAEEKAAEPASTAENKSAISSDAKQNVQQTLDKMGESETKMADPNENPLEKELNDLLDSK